MKFIKILFLLFCLKAMLFAGEFNVYEGFEKAQVENKPVFFVVVNAGCPHCVSFFKDTIYPNFEILNRDFVFAFSDLVKGDKVPSNLKFNGIVPSTYIIAPNGQALVGPIEGNFDSKYLHYLLGELYKSYSLNY